MHAVIRGLRGKKGQGPLTINVYRRRSTVAEPPAEVGASTKAAAPTESAAPSDHAAFAKPAPKGDEGEEDNKDKDEEEEDDGVKGQLEEEEDDGVKGQLEQGRAPTPPSAKRAPEGSAEGSAEGPPAVLDANDTNDANIEDIEDRFNGLDGAVAMPAGGVANPNLNINPNLKSGWSDGVMEGGAPASAPSDASESPNRAGSLGPTGVPDPKPSRSRWSIKAILGFKGKGKKGKENKSNTQQEPGGWPQSPSAAERSSLSVRE